MQVEGKYMNLKEHYKQLLKTSLNESELASATREDRPVRTDLVLHQAGRISRLIQKKNAELLNTPIKNPKSSEEAEAQRQSNPSYRTAERLGRLVSMTGMTPRTGTKDYSDRFGSLGQHVVQVQTMNDKSRFSEPGKQSIGPDWKSDVKVGEIPASAAIKAKVASQKERSSRLGAIRAATKASRSIGSV